MSDIRVSIRSPAVNVSVETEQTTVRLGRVVRIIEGEHYTGSLSVTPSMETQTLLTADKILDGNVVVEPIPSNYGLITYNGFGLTVS